MIDKIFGVIFICCILYNVYRLIKWILLTSSIVIWSILVTLYNFTWKTKCFLKKGYFVTVNEKGYNRLMFKCDSKYCLFKCRSLISEKRERPKIAVYEEY